MAWDRLNSVSGTMSTNVIRPQGSVYPRLRKSGEFSETTPSVRRNLAAGARLAHGLQCLFNLLIKPRAAIRGRFSRVRS